MPLELANELIYFEARLRKTKYIAVKTDYIEMHNAASY